MNIANTLIECDAVTHCRQCGGLAGCLQLADGSGGLCGGWCAECRMFHGQVWGSIEAQRAVEKVLPELGFECLEKDKAFKPHLPRQREPRAGDN